MVYGLEKFKQYFEGYTDKYVIIGGTACDILFRDFGMSFRATKDSNIVLISEALNKPFGERFWKFIEDGKYTHNTNMNDNINYYRFDHPKEPGYPRMIELFSRHPNHVVLNKPSHIVPIHIDDGVSSLSAILLNQEYYDLILEGRIIIDGISLLNVETIILFKIRAWVDLKDRKMKGEEVSNSNIKKHKNDVFRLLVFIRPNNKIVVSANIRKDVQRFITMDLTDRPNLEDLKIKNSTFDEMVGLLENVFILKE